VCRRTCACREALCSYVVWNTNGVSGCSGGGGAYSGTPSDIGVGDNLLVAPTGSTITAFGSTGSRF
jgi:hypothetical protein